MLSWIILAVFALTYGFLCLSKHYRTIGLWLGICLMVVAGFLFHKAGTDNLLSPLTLARDAINWNVLGVLVGAMIIADLFLESGVPVLLADLIAGRCKTAHMALLGVCFLSGLISTFMDNTTTVLLVAPIALAVAQRTALSPVPFLIGIAVSANLQGAATLIGDPPSMLLAGFYRLGFNDFFFKGGKPFIFFAIEAGAIAGLFVLYFIFKRHTHDMTTIEIVKPKTWLPVAFIIIMVAFLATSSHFDPGFQWLAGTGNIILGTFAILCTVWRDPATAKGIIKRYEFPTIFFLSGIFIMAYAMDQFGWVQAIANGISSIVGQNVFVAYTLIVWLSVLVSAFIDNIAYVAVMLPVTKVLAESIGGNPLLYAGGLLIGACLGGNITPIGASCNVVAVGILRRHGHHVSFWEFAKIGLPFTLAATAAGYIFLWFVWG